MLLYLRGNQPLRGHTPGHCSRCCRNWKGYEMKKDGIWAGVVLGVILGVIAVDFDCQSSCVNDNTYRTVFGKTISCKVIK